MMVAVFMLKVVSTAVRFFQLHICESYMVFFVFFQLWVSFTKYIYIFFPVLCVYMNIFRTRVMNFRENFVLSSKSTCECYI